MFLGCAPFDKNVEQYGPGVELSWRIVGGTHDGAIATRIAGTKMTPKSTLTKFASAFAGGPLRPGSKFCFDAYIGRAGTLLVEATDSGGSRVATFFADPIEAVEKF